MQLFHCFGSRSLRALWMLEELDIPYDLTILPFPPQRSEAFCALNPLKTVPFLIDNEIRLSESTSICLYLATAYAPNALVIDPSDKEYADWLEWIVFAETSLTQPLALVLHYGGKYKFDEYMQPPQRIEPVVNYYSAKLRLGISHLAEILKNRQFVAADRFTAADIAVAYNFRLAELIGLAEFFAPVADYWKRVSSRPAYLRAIAAEKATA